MPKQPTIASIGRVVASENRGHFVLKGKLDKCINWGEKRNLPYILSGRDEICRLRPFDRNKG